MTKRVEPVAIARSLASLALMGAGVFERALARLRQRLVATPRWVAGILIPELLQTATDDTSVGSGVSLALAYAVAPMGGEDADLEALEQTILRALEPGNPGLGVSAPLALHIVRDRDRCRSALDRVFEASGDSTPSLLGLRALAARDAADLEQIVARAVTAYRRFPSADCAAVVGMREAELGHRWDLSELLNTTGPLFRHYLSYLETRVSASGCSGDGLLAEVVTALATTSSHHRRIPLLRWLSKVAAAQVPHLLIDEMNRESKSGPQLAARAGLALASTLPLHLVSWPSALLDLKPATERALSDAANWSPAARRFLLFSGRAQVQPGDARLFRYDAYPRSRHPRDPLARSSSSFEDLRALAAAPDRALRVALTSDDYFMREGAAERLSSEASGSQHLGETVTQGSRSGSPSVRLRAAELAPWTSAHDVVHQQLRWDEAPLVRSAASRIPWRAADINACSRACAVLSDPSEGEWRWRAWETLAARSTSAQLRRAAELAERGGRSDSGTASFVAEGVMVSVDDAGEATAWSPHLREQGSAEISLSDGTRVSARVIVLNSELGGSRLVVPIEDEWGFADGPDGLPEAVYLRQLHRGVKRTSVTEVCEVDRPAPRVVGVGAAVLVVASDCGEHGERSGRD